MGFQKRVYWETPSRNKRKEDKPQKTGAFVDLTAQDGAEWVKVSTMTEKRLMHELAGKGYNPEDSPDEDEDEDDVVDLVKAARDLRKASGSTRVRYKVVFSHTLIPFHFHRSLWCRVFYSLATRRVSTGIYTADAIGYLVTGYLRYE